MSWLSAKYPFPSSLYFYFPKIAVASSSAFPALGSSQDHSVWNGFGFIVSASRNGRQKNTFSWPLRLLSWWHVLLCEDEYDKKQPFNWGRSRGQRWAKIQLIYYSCPRKIKGLNKVSWEREDTTLNSEGWLEFLQAFSRHLFICNQYLYTM